MENEILTDFLKKYADALSAMMRDFQELSLESPGDCPGPADTLEKIMINQICMYYQLLGISDDNEKVDAFNDFIFQNPAEWKKTIKKGLLTWKNAVSIVREKHGVKDNVRNLFD